MILIKLLPLWLTLTLITAASRPERRRRDVFSRAHWWEAAFKAPRRGRQWPKRGSSAAPFYESCVCSESQGWHDLGDGHWPQVVPSRQCGFGVSAVTRQCVAPEPDEGFACRQRTYAVRVLRRREAPTLGGIAGGADAPAPGRDTLPPELRDDWEFVERHVNSSCELVQV